MKTLTSVEQLRNAEPGAYVVSGAASDELLRQASPSYAMLKDIAALELDAEMRIAHMNGDATAFEWSEAIINYIPRLTFLESEYGRARNSEDVLMTLSEDESVEAFSMFSLFIAAELRHQMDHSAKLM